MPMNIYESRDIEMGKPEAFNKKLDEISKEGWKIVSVVPFMSKFIDINRNVLEKQYARVILEKKGVESGGTIKQVING